MAIKKVLQENNIDVMPVNTYRTTYKDGENKTLEDDINSIRNDIDYIKNNGVPSVGNDSPNAIIPLFIKTIPEGKNQAIHPSVKYFKDRLFNYKFWMAYTPYPNTDATHENPSITVSQNGMNWIDAPGISNPLDKPSLIIGEGLNYFSDTHFVYNSDLRRLEIWYRGVTTGTKEIIYRKWSTNGTTWSEREELMRSEGGDTNLVCPTVVYENGVYNIWVQQDRARIRYFTSADGTNWNFVANTNINTWHFDILKTSKGYEFVGTNGVYAISQDKINFTGQKVVMPNGNRFSWDKGGVYKPCLVDVDGIYYYYYSTQANTGLSVSIDNSIDTLKGLGLESLYWYRDFIKIN